MNAAQDQHRDYPPQQRPVLILGGNREVAEDERDDEDVVDGKRLLEGVAREVFHARGRAHGPPQPGAERKRDSDVEHRQLQAFRDTELFILLVKNAEVEGEQRADYG
jgi:hypothetical protein